MKVLVTGGCGFLGSHICEFYRKKGDQVISFDNMTKFELDRSGYASETAREYNWNYLSRLNVEMIRGDITSTNSMMEASVGADYIIHTAAQPAMTISLEYPDLDLRVNIVGTFNVLEAARRHNIPVAICSTIHVYGNQINENLKEAETRYMRAPVAIDEQHPVMEGLITPLHVSKRAAELYAQAYISSYKLRAAIFRLTGLYGPRQFGGEDHGWVANFAIRALTEKPLRIFGTGKQVRDIIYPSDVARAFQAFYENGSPGIYNIGGGPDYAISLLECIDLIGKVIGRRPELIFEKDRIGDLRYFICDISKAKSELRWEPKVTPREGIGMLVDWLVTEKALFQSSPMRK